ncbi:hypothetical protein GIB67_008727 [Kingdonia uniflora]|uniref:hAT-like transposase RNase-H fold domain-containing protein n=1 Tax=Kingdonia uniflora TaxID=39325 RepID=A0A7J7P5X1_9MAGN|nr:hypothetical protein GIB67_008727 [Kingdonia uniflora]
MVEKYDKYWDLKKLNPLLLVGVVLDLRLKLDYIEFGLTGLYDEAPGCDSALYLLKVQENKVELWIAFVLDMEILRYGPYGCGCGPCGEKLEL